MAVTTTTASGPLITTIITDTDSDITVETAAGAAQYLYFVEITNPNSSVVYTKFITAASGSSPTTQHYIQLYCPSSCYWTSVLQFYTTWRSEQPNQPDK